MLTNIDINNSLLKEAPSVSRVKTKKDLLHETLREYIRLKEWKDLAELAGLIEFYEGYDQKNTGKPGDDFC